MKIKLIIITLSLILSFTLAGCDELYEAYLPSKSGEPEKLSLPDHDQSNGKEGPSEKSADAKKNGTESNDIGEERAIDVALSHSSKSRESVTALSVRAEYDDGVKEYDVEFFDGQYEYSYEIRATDGKILSYERDLEKRGGNNPTESVNTNSRIDAARAKAIALAHAGLGENGVRFLRAELDLEDGKYVFEVEFTAGGFEYDYEINAEDGSVIRHEKEKDD